MVLNPGSSSGLDHPAPAFLLAVVDFAEIEIEHLALHHLAAGAALALDNAPVAVLLAVLEASIRAQIHGKTNLRQTIPLKRYLVSTTREFRNLVFETTRFSLPPNPEIRRLPAPVEKVGLTSLARTPGSIPPGECADPLALMALVSICALP